MSGPPEVIRRLESYVPGPKYPQALPHPRASRARAAAPCCQTPLSHRAGYSPARGLPEFLHTRAQPRTRPGDQSCHSPTLTRLPRQGGTLSHADQGMRKHEEPAPDLGLQRIAGQTRQIVGPASHDLITSISQNS